MELDLTSIHPITFFKPNKFWYTIYIDPFREKRLEIWPLFHACLGVGILLNLVLVPMTIFFFNKVPLDASKKIFEIVPVININIVHKKAKYELRNLHPSIVIPLLLRVASI
jgi:hypothetical protein